MVEIRVVVADDREAHGLLRQLVGVFDRSSISFDGPRNAVCVDSEWESRSVLKMIAAVHAWLAAEGASGAELWVGERSYAMVGSGIADAGRYTPSDALVQERTDPGFDQRQRPAAT